jgi:quinol monooxygenase YgiN
MQAGKKSGLRLALRIFNIFFHINLYIMKNSKLVADMIFLFFLFSYTISYAQQKNNLIVLVKYKTIPGASDIALAKLKNLITKVKDEPHFVSVIIHMDPSDSSNVLLCEEWADADYYKGDHMNTAHLQQFIAESRAFLAGPPEISFWIKER